MSSSTYSRLPSKFNFRDYYLNQAGGGPSFPIYRARQRGGFLGPLLKRHGIPFLRWIGRQAASLASNAGNAYLEKGSLSKEDMKGMLKQQGKKAARSALDSLKQQIGSGAMMNQRRDGRLAALVPSYTKRREGTITALHGIRAPSLTEHGHPLGSSPLGSNTSNIIVRTRRQQKRKSRSKRKVATDKKRQSKKANKKKKGVTKKKTTKKSKANKKTKSRAKPKTGSSIKSIFTKKRRAKKVTEAKTLFS